MVFIPGDVRCVEHCKARVVLVISHVQIILEVVGFCIPGVGSVEKGAEEESCEDGNDPAMVSTALELTVGRELPDVQLQKDPLRHDRVLRCLSAADWLLACIVNRGLVLAYLGLSLAASLESGRHLLH